MLFVKHPGCVVYIAAYIVGYMKVYLQYIHTHYCEDAFDGPHFTLLVSPESATR